MVGSTEYGVRDATNNNNVADADGSLARAAVWLAVGMGVEGLPCSLSGGLVVGTLGFNR